MSEELGSSVDDLADEVQLLRIGLARRTRWLWGTIAAVVLVAGVALGGAYYLINQRLQIDCEFYAPLASAPLPSNASDLGRRIVGGANQSYAKRNCDQITGPLPTTASPSPSTR